MFEFLSFELIVHDSGVEPRPIGADPFGGDAGRMSCQKAGGTAALVTLNIAGARVARSVGRTGMGWSESMGPHGSQHRSETVIVLVRAGSARTHVSCYSHYMVRECSLTGSTLLLSLSQMCWE